MIQAMKQRSEGGAGEKKAAGERRCATGLDSA